MVDLVGILVPIFICVVLPVAIVFITAWVKMNGENKRAEIILKAIEANNSVDADKLAESLRKPQKSAREILNNRLLYGCIFSLLGIICMLIAMFNYANGVEVWADQVTIPLLGGGACLAIGVSYLIVYVVTRKQVDNDSRK